MRTVQHAAEGASIRTPELNVTTARMDLREQPTTILKVKSHRGFYLNEQADRVAGEANTAPDDEVETRYHGFEPMHLGLIFTWHEDDAEQPTITSEPKLVHKRWGQVYSRLATQRTRDAGTYAGTFLTDPEAGRHLLSLSRFVLPWSTTEERRWMQQVAHILPLNGYLH